MYIKNYRSILKNIQLHQLNFYNSQSLNSKLNVKIMSNFNTFGGEKNLKLTKLCNLLYAVSNQKPLLKSIGFKHLKKKILKSFRLTSSLNALRAENFLLYFLSHYLYFFQIYYQRPIKYGYTRSQFNFYLDNLQYFFKNYNKQNQKTQLKVSFRMTNFQQKILLMSLSNFFVVRIRVKKK